MGTGGVEVFQQVLSGLDLSLHCTQPSSASCFAILARKIPLVYVCAVESQVKIPYSGMEAGIVAFTHPKPASELNVKSLCCTHL